MRGYADIMSITRKYILYTFILVFTLGLIIYPLEMYSSYRREIERVNHQLQQVRDSHIPFLISSLWLTHYDLLQQQIDAIARFSHIDAVTVTDDEGNLFTAGSTAAPNLRVNREALMYNYQGSTIEIGELTLYINEQQIRRDVYREELGFILFHFVLALLIGALISYLFHALAGKHLRRLSDAMRDDSVSSFTTPITLDRKKRHDDELEYLTDSINAMRSRLRTQLEEKDLLLREVHHRIKNNMFTVESLLAFQAQTVNNPETSEALIEAKSRLRSMGVLYDRLYRSGNISDMSIRDYLPPLIDEIASLQTNGSSVQIKTEIDDIIMNSDSLAALGILLNELLTNSMKHAFPDGKKGTISVVCSSPSPQHAFLVYRDDGIGLPDSVLAGKSEGLGITLIKILAGQLKGTVEMRRDRGTVIEIEFMV
ncbi:MAG: histidine kinase dimerization/phosphoacceptor domain -containing protein [Spirochaetota bacterium]|nr:histidine kinase dimerization/phosphoacceptor domain -containing protein [Spirochaetota bacterium]